MYEQGLDLLVCCRHPSGNESSVQSLKRLLANNAAQQAISSSSRGGQLHAEDEDEDEDIELDPEYAPKRPLTTKVRQPVWVFLDNHNRFTLLYSADPSQSMRTHKPKSVEFKMQDKDVAVPHVVLRGRLSC